MPRTVNMNRITSLTLTAWLLASVAQIVVGQWAHGEELDDAPPNPPPHRQRR